MHHRAKDITDLKVGFLTVTHYVGSNGRRSLWEARCVCGNTVTLPASELQKQHNRGVEASCGCRRKESIGRRNRTHGMSFDDAYAVYRSMLARCSNPNHQAWHNYGGRGITVCDRWKESFQNFWADMGPTYEKGLTLERLDNEQGYSIENCSWETPKHQARNKRDNVIISTPWGEMTVAEAAERSGLNVTTLHYRIGVGVTGSQLFSAPDHTRRFF